MYNQSSNIDVVYIIAGAISIVIIITFFIMAFRLKKIMEYLSKMSGIAVLRAKKDGIIELWCPACDKKYFFHSSQPRPVICPCGKDLTEILDKKMTPATASSQTDKTDTV